MLRCQFSVVLLDEYTKNCWISAMFFIPLDVQTDKFRFPLLFGKTLLVLIHFRLSGHSFFLFDTFFFGKYTNGEYNERKGVFEWSSVSRFVEMKSPRWNDVLCWVSVCVHNFTQQILMYVWSHWIHFVSCWIRLCCVGLLVYRWTLFAILCLCVRVCVAIVASCGLASIPFIRFSMQ